MTRKPAVSQNVVIVLNQLVHEPKTTRQLQVDLDRGYRSTQHIVGCLKAQGLISHEGRHYAITEDGLEKLAEIDRVEVVL